MKSKMTEFVSLQLNLVCDRKYLATVIKMLFFGGRLFGAVVLGQVSDR